MLEKSVQAAIYEKALKNHYIEILYIDFENTGKCIRLHQDTKLSGGENIFPESDEQMFEEYVCDKIMRYDPVFITRGFAEVMETTQQQMMLLQKKPFCETVHPDDQQYVEESVRSLNMERPHTNIFYRKRNPQGKWFYMQSDLSYLIVGKKKYIYVTYQDVCALQKNEEYWRSQPSCRNQGKSCRSLWT